MKWDSRGVSIHYEVRGQGRPFVMLHGSPSDHARAMAHVEPAFRPHPRWRRIYPDLPGHGLSPGSDRIRDMDDYFDSVLRFVDAVVEGRRFALGGSSFGAYLALGVARKRRSRLTGLLLSVPEISHSPSGERRAREPGTRTIPNRVELARGLPRYVEDTRWLTSLPFRDISVPLYQTSRRLLAPALFLFGGQDAPVRYQTYWRMLRQFPKATFAVLDGAGHRLWTDRSRTARLLVGDWLERIERAFPGHGPSGSSEPGP